MLYPVIPLYFSHIGLSVVFIGVVEGLAEATAGLSKGYFGYLSDVTGKRKPFVQAGYGLSAIAKPLIGLVVEPFWILSMRIFERLGKGIRTAPRDAILSDQSQNETKGRVFGFHRAFDTLGAAIGPLIALIYLTYNPVHYQSLFLISLIPGVIAVTLTFFIKDVPLRQNHLAGISFNPLIFLRYWKYASANFRFVVTILLLFALVNSSDVFLLLLMKTKGLSDTEVIFVYIFYNMVYAFFSYPLGVVGDKLGLQKTFATGLLLFAIVYGGMAVSSSLSVFLFLFFVYGIYAASTEGVSKAWISNIVPSSEVATAIGFYTSLQSVCTLIASVTAGWIWSLAGASVLFGLTSIIVAIVSITLFFKKNI